MSEQRILAFGYACDPHGGSEPGVGWAWGQMLASIGETWLITRANNREAIEAELSLSERDRLHFVYVDLPGWARWWKRGQRGVRLYYLLWQLAALRRARELHKEVTFTLVWHLTLANAWLGSVGGLVGPPLVYGPVGGGIGSPPLRIVTALGPRAVLYELTRDVARSAGRYLNPMARLAWMRARVILVQNPETKTWFPKRHRDRIVVFPNPILDLAAPARRTGQPAKTAVFAGRFLPTKGAEIAVRAVAATPDWCLLVCGGGIGEGRLRRLVRQLALEERVLVLGPQRRERLFEMLRSADVLLYPSLREDGGWIVVEALACGLPVICVDRGGPPVLAGAAGLVVARSGDIDAIAAALGERLAGSALPAPDVLRARAAHFSSERTCQRLRRLLGATGLVRSTPSEVEIV